MSFGDQLIIARSSLTFNPDFIDPKEPTGLWFCESAEDVQAVSINAVKLAEGAEWKDLLRCEKFLRSFPYVFVSVANEERRQALVDRLRQVLPALEVYIPAPGAFRGCRNVWEFREQFGLSRLQELLIDARELPVYGLLNLSDILPWSPGEIPRFRSGIPELDRFTGGFYGGQLSLWTGERGLGKSTLLSQLLLEAVDQGAVVCAYSGELSREQFKEWAVIQAAGPEHVGVYDDRETGRKLSAVAASVRKRIDEWWDKRFFLYDVGTASSHSEDTILSVFENARRCYGASVFLVDNIMTIGLKGGRDGEYFRAQSHFAGRLVQFAKQHEAHVHLVAHPRKADGGRKKLTSDDVGGSGDLPNRADNVFALEQGVIKLQGEDVSVRMIRCLKNRMFGGTRQVAMAFDVKSRRFYRPGEAADKQYGWERQGEQMAIHEIEETADMPF